MPFIQESYDTYNQKGIKLLSDYLVSRGFELVAKEKEDYNIDIIAYKNGKKYLFEAEMKKDRSITTPEDFYNTVSFLSRKKKFAEKNEFIYFIISNKNSGAICASSGVIFEEKHRIQKYISKDGRKGLEDFYEVPRELCRFFPPEEFLINKDNA
jgi:Holliday junction resolvase